MNLQSRPPDRREPEYHLYCNLWPFSTHLFPSLPLLCFMFYFSLLSTPLLMNPERKPSSQYFFPPSVHSTFIREKSLSGHFKIKDLKVPSSPLPVLLPPESRTVSIK
ncbi:hypothetical protein CDAR_35751 [Caerostris darwini]|uniref:Uncharacterized protein n=1 Tax=Caerostris darwini TaxID=1538125 RepID=A0AAV4VCB9_9ARAC|nr:hypothetical protein CDAR_35751 [Caerostris darwini]